MPRQRFLPIGLLVLTMMSSLSCQTGESKKKKSQYDQLDGGIPPVTAECSAPADDCWKDCFKREASRVCAGCCRDQQLLCDLKRELSFEYCKSAQ